MKIALIIYIAGIIAVTISIVMNTWLINKQYPGSKFRLPLWSKTDTKLLLYTGWISWIMVLIIWEDYKSDIQWHKTMGKIFNKLEQL